MPMWYKGVLCVEVLSMLYSGLHDNHIFTSLCWGTGCSGCLLLLLMQCLPPAAFEGSGHGMRPITLSSPLDEGRCDRVAGQSHVDVDVGSPLPIRAMTFEIDARYNMFRLVLGRHGRANVKAPPNPRIPCLLQFGLYHFTAAHLAKTCASQCASCRVPKHHVLRRSLPDKCTHPTARCPRPNQQPQSKSSSSVTQTNAAQDLV